MKMKMHKIMVLSGLALMISACASSPSPEDLGELAYTGFSERSDGTAYHKVMGVTCPAAIGSLTRSRAQVYDENGTDISCNYVDNQSALTVYLSQFPRDTLGTVFQNAKTAIEYRLGEDGYEYSDELSETCSSATIDQTSILSGLAGLLSGENTSNEITLSPSPSAVYVKGSDLTLVVVEEMFKNEFFKVRFTGPYSDKSSVDGACELIRDTYLEMEASVREDRGMAPPKGGSLLDAINASEDN